MDSDSDVEILSAPLPRGLAPAPARPNSTALFPGFGASLSSSPDLPAPSYARAEAVAGPSKPRVPVQKVEAIYLDSVRPPSRPLSSLAHEVVKDEDDSALPPEFRIDRSNVPIQYDLDYVRLEG